MGNAYFGGAGQGLPSLKDSGDSLLANLAEEAKCVPRTAPQPRSPKKRSLP